MQQQFGQSLRLDNTQAPAYQGVGDCYLGKGDRDNALKYYRYAAQLDPSNAAVQAHLIQLAAPAPDTNSPEAAAQQLYRARSYADALASYQTALASDTQNPRLYLSIGNCQLALHDEASALASFKKSLDLDPSNTGLADLVQRIGRRIGGGQWHCRGGGAQRG